MNLKNLVLLGTAISICEPVTANTLTASLDDITAVTDAYYISFNSRTFGAVVDNGDGGGELLHAFWDNNQLVFPTVGFLASEQAVGSLISFSTNNQRQTLNDLHFRDSGDFFIEPAFGYQIDSIDYEINFSGGNNGLASGVYLNGGANSRDVYAQWAAGAAVQNVVPGQLVQLETQTAQTTLTFLLPNNNETPVMSVLNNTTIAQLPNGADDSEQEAFGNSSITINQQVFRQAEDSDSFIGGAREVFLSTLVAGGNVAGIGSFTGILGIESIRMQVNTSAISPFVISVPWPNMLWLWLLGLPITALVARVKHRN